MPLRVFHTADWHLGHTFHAYDRDCEHARFLAWLLDALTARRPDVLLVAGDVFDTINPSATAQRRYYAFLAEARRRLPALQIVIIAGNHDAAARLEAPSAVLEAFSISVVGTVTRDETGAPILDRLIVPLRNAAGRVEALALAVPFLRPADVPVVANSRDPYLDGIRELYRRVIDRASELRASQHPGAALIALGHLHLTAAEESPDSERRVVIGGAEALGADIFPATLAYVALGHLHKPQQFEGGRIRYCGSPIPLSFSERSYGHRVVELTLADGALGSAETVSIPRAVELLRIPKSGSGSAEDVVQAIAALPAATTMPADEHPYLEVHVTEDRPNPDLRRRIEEAVTGKAARLALIKRTLNVAVGDATPARAATADLSSLKAEELLAEHHREKYGTEVDPGVLQALREIVAAMP